MASVNTEITLERDYLYHTSMSSLGVPNNANVLGISGIFLLFNPWVIPTAHRAKQGVMVYFLFLESPTFLWLFESWGADCK